MKHGAIFVSFALAVGVLTTALPEPASAEKKCNPRYQDCSKL